MGVTNCFSINMCCCLNLVSKGHSGYPYKNNFKILHWRNKSVLFNLLKLSVSLSKVGRKWKWRLNIVFTIFWPLSFTVSEKCCKSKTVKKQADISLKIQYLINMGSSPSAKSRTMTWFYKIANGPIIHFFVKRKFYCHFSLAQSATKEKDMLHMFISNI